jgi:ABC-type phosphate transport system substrate-binding protein
MIARRLPLLVLAVTVCSAVLSAGDSKTGKDLPPGALQLRGGGSTFAAPLQKKSHSIAFSGNALSPS